MADRAAVVGAIVIGGAVTVAVLARPNVIDLGKLAFWQPKRRSHPIPPGWIGIPLSFPTDPGLHGGHPGILDGSENGRHGIEMGTRGRGPAGGGSRKGLLIDFGEDHRPRDDTRDTGHL